MRHHGEGCLAETRRMTPAVERWSVCSQMKPQSPKDDESPLNYERPPTEPDECGAWVGLIITLALCLAAAIVYLARQ